VALLEINNAGIAFGGLRAVSNCNIALEPGELIGLIGPNGAGKTTVFNMLTGVYLPSEGDIVFEGKSVVGLKPYNITKSGIARTFQNIRLFKDLTVLDNVKIPYHIHAKHGVISSVFRLPAYYRGEKEITERALECLDVFGLADKRHELSKNLPYGQQRRLEIARALAAQPRLLLLDEPAAGMNPQETHDLMELIQWIRDKFNLTILLIEHDMTLVMGVCERIYVLDYGRIIAEGTPDEIKSNPQVIKAYLGEEVRV
jgi:branched-chain amino acid transport system ATP-binding protein